MIDKTQSKFSNLRKIAENLIKDSNQVNTQIPINDLGKIIHELDVYRIELEIQNEQLREAEEQREKSEKRFFELFEFAPIGYAVLNDDATIEQINKAGKSYFKGTKTTFKTLRLSSLALPPIENFHVPFVKAQRTGEKQTTEVQFTRGKDLFWTRLVFSVWEEKKDQKKILCSISDITNEKKYQIELENHKKNLEDIIKERTSELESANNLLKQEIEARKQSEKNIEASLKEKEILLRELQHRVKNNMQLIMSLLNYQARKIKNTELKEMFNDTLSRIRSMSLIHDILYTNKALATINLGAYIRLLINHIKQLYSGRNPNIKILVDSEEVPISIDHAIPCGLIINELVTNSVKYAFPEKQEGVIAVIVKQLNNQTVNISIYDDGIGFKHNDSKDLSTSGIGLDIVKNLTEKQLGGYLEFDSTKGTSCNIQFNISKNI
ncbi:MAG: PAS domain S-box protein [Desulfobacterales bacterium]|nr:PAS domain S-box protein [Desulfobacterales bacterium]